MKKIAHGQISKYLNENNLIFVNQSGFRESYSTDTALTFLSERILNNMDKGLYSGAIVIDLKKAFDTVDHTILLDKFQAMGACPTVFDWLSSYLDNREQFVKVGKGTSTSLNIKCGVPQGSILGPLLFTIYVNDMYSSVDCDLFLYADDSFLFSCNKEIKLLQDTLCRNMHSLGIWLNENKLTLHPSKCKSILFNTKRKLRKIII